MHVYEMALLRYGQIMKNTKNPKKLKNKCNCKRSSIIGVEEIEKIAKRLTLRVRVKYGIVFDTVKKIGRVKYLPSGKISYRYSFLDILRRNTGKVAGEYHANLRTVIICEESINDLRVLAHEFAHAIEHIELEPSSEEIIASVVNTVPIRMEHSLANKELLASVVAYMFVCEYTGHICENYKKHIGYPMRYDAQVSDLEFLKEDIFFVFNQMHALMQEH